MGMFDFSAETNFLKDVGKRLFGIGDDDSSKSDAIEQHVQQSLNNPNIKVEHDNGNVRLSGTASSAAEAQKAVLLAGNVEGVEKVDGSQLQAPQDQQAETYEIKSGDTLSKIAQHVYGHANEWHRLFDANREVIQDPDLIYPGQVIRVPR